MPPDSDVIAAAIQLNSQPRWQDNRETLAALIASAACEHQASIVLLPENFAAMPVDDAGRKAVSEPALTATIVASLRQWSQQYGIFLVAGGMLWRASEHQPRASNRCLVFSPQGEIIASYDKIHCFDACVDGQDYRESASIEAGSQPVSVDLAGWRTGLSICYDLRFAELYRHYSQHGCQLLLVPAAFTWQTGQAHWEVLLRARAIENQCYILAAGQCGVHADGRRSRGHSMLIDPWGQVLTELDEAPGVLCGRLNAAHLAAVRYQLPALQHRKL